MDLKNGIKNLKENKTLRHILEILLAIGNYLNGVEVNFKNKLFEIKSIISSIVVNRFST
jgi:hypothetical protein